MKPKKERLDVLMVELGLAESRTKAKSIIMAGKVLVDGHVTDKAGSRVSLEAEIKCKDDPCPYVSRGGMKLDGALKDFDIDVAGKTALDVGASTGGFTDCLLQHGAQRVIAVDVGYGQLDWKLRQDPRVEILEKTNIRYLKPKDVDTPIHGAVFDVSFISLKLVVPPVSNLLEKQSYMIALIKPQFEVGKGQVGKGGVVRDPNLHQHVIENLKDFFETLGWAVKGHMPSPILGPKGNREFLMYLTRK